MELKLTFRHAGIDWQVEVDVNDEWGIEQIFSVRIYDENSKKYTAVSCDTEEFLEIMQDFLYDAVEEEKQSAKEFAEDMRFEQMREEKGE